MFRSLSLYCLLALAFSLPTAAQTLDAAWSVWLLDPTSGNAWLVSDDGTVLRQHSGFTHSGNYINHFPRIPSEIMEFPDIAVSTTGRYFAYIRDDKLRVLDTSTGHEVLEYNLTINNEFPNFNSFTYSWVRRLFNENDTMLAFGVNRSNYQTLEGGWEIIVLDLITKEVVVRLHDTDADAQVNGLPGFNFVPIIQHFDGTEISFFLFPDGMESGPSYAGWTWNIETGHIKPNRAFTTHSTDYFTPTDEVIFPVSDHRLEQFPCEGECGQFVHINTLHVSSPAVDLPFPFYHSPTIHFWQAHFIQNAEKIVAQGISYESYPEQVWQMVGRDGELIADITDLHIASITGIPKGLIFTQDGSPHLLQMNTYDGLSEPVILWTNPDGGTPLILWTSEPIIQTTYIRWAQLAPPQ